MLYEVITVGIDLEVLFVDLHFDVVGQFGKDENGTERGMASGIGVEGGNADQPMDAVFGPEKTVGVFSYNFV